MNQTKKSPQIEDYLNSFTNRTEAITNDRCVEPPIGCGEPVLVNEFRNEISLKEYRMSGLCQKCQDAFFGE